MHEVFTLFHKGNDRQVSLVCLGDGVRDVFLTRAEDGLFHQDPLFRKAAFGRKGASEHLLHLVQALALFWVELVFLACDVLKDELGDGPKVNAWTFHKLPTPLNGVSIPHENAVCRVVDDAEGVRIGKGT